MKLQREMNKDKSWNKWHKKQKENNRKDSLIQKLGVKTNKIEKPLEVWLRKEETAKMYKISNERGDRTTATGRIIFKSKRILHATKWQ